MFFRDIKLILEQYVNGDVTIETIKDIVDDLDIKSHIPIIKKYAIIDTFRNKLFSMSTDMDRSTTTELEGFYITYDIGLKFSILSSYGGVVYAEEECTAENYDLIMQSGFYDMFLEKCGRDVKQFIEICDRVVGINNTWMLNELNTIFCDTVNVNNMQKIIDMLNNEVDKDTLQKLQEVQLLANPALTNVLNYAKKESADKVMNRPKPKKK